MSQTGAEHEHVMVASSTNPTEPVCIALNCPDDPVTPRERAIEALSGLGSEIDLYSSDYVADAVLAALREGAVERVARAFQAEYPRRWHSAPGPVTLARTAVAALLGADPTPTTEET